MMSVKLGFLIAGLLVLTSMVACYGKVGNVKAAEFFTPEQVKLLEAIQKGDKPKAETMLHNGLSLNVHGDEGITPLFWLMGQKEDDAVALALQLGADPNFTSADGRHPVPTAAGGDDDQLLGLLLEFGGNPNAQYMDGKPAIFHAIGFQRLSQVELLLHHGADPDVTDLTGKNSVLYAVVLNQFEIAHGLIESGADYTKRYQTGADTAWVVHDKLSNNLINPNSDAYRWAHKVRTELQERGVKFPPPSPRELRDQWIREENQIPRL